MLRRSRAEFQSAGRRQNTEGGGVSECEATNASDIPGVSDKRITRPAGKRMRINALIDAEADPSTTRHPLYPRYTRVNKISPGNKAGLVNKVRRRAVREQEAPE